MVIIFQVVSSSATLVNLIFASENTKVICLKYSMLIYRNVFEILSFTCVLEIFPVDVDIAQ